MCEICKLANVMVHLCFKCKIGDESGDEDEIGVENEARGSRKRDKKRQEREAQRQVILVSITHFILNYTSFK